MGESNCLENSGGVKPDAGSSPALSSIKEDKWVITKYHYQMNDPVVYVINWDCYAYQVHDKPARNWSDYI
jgi:hypothetical protein